MRILMVSGEYPPMFGGVGRYTSNLVRALGKHAEVLVVCDKSNVINKENVFNVIRRGDYNNSTAILQLIKETKPDLVHVQYENAIYEKGTTIYDIIRKKFLRLPLTTLDRLYRRNSIPTITTPHTIYPYEEYLAYFKEGINRKEGRFRFLPMTFRVSVRKWVLDQSYKLLTHIPKLSNEVINLTKVTYNMLQRGKIIYHGAEPEISKPNKEEFRKELRLPLDKMLILAFGYTGSSKGLQILNEICLPKDCAIVTKLTQHYRKSECTQYVRNAINLDSGYISEEGMSKLFFACDAVILPYQIVAVSGVLFDALAHGLPFVSSNLAFFKEFAEMGLGIATCREPKALSLSINFLVSEYKTFQTNVENFRPQLRWDLIASKHIKAYSEFLERP